MTLRKPLTELRASLRETFRGVREQWRHHPILLLASGISFHAMLCLIPLILLGTSLLGVVLNSSEAAVRQIHATITAAFPANPYSGRIQETLHGVLADIIRYRSSFGWFGMAILLWTSTSLLDAVRTALNSIFHLRGSESFLRGMLKNIVLTIVLTLLFLIANLTTWLFVLAGSLLEHWEILRQAQVRSTLPMVILLFSDIPVCLMFYILYHYIPSNRIAPRAALTGAAVASVIWWVSGLLFGWYLTSFGSLGSLYGTYAFMIVFLLWIYYSSTAFMVGAMICQEYRKRHERLV
jgi:YihY family inner membrane protein